MPISKELTLAYIKSRPIEAARALERLPTADSAVLFSDLPSRLAAPVFSELLPTYSARCIESLTPDRTTNLLRRIGVPAATAILRVLDETRRAIILEQLPAATAVACRLLLRYPEDSIGALADVEVPTFLPETTVRDSLARLKASTADTGDFIYVVDDERRLRACLRPSALLHAVGTQTLVELPHPTVPDLPAQASPVSVRDHDGWRSFSTLPIVERRRRFVGALRQGRLMQALAAAGRQTAPAMPGDSLNVMTDAYWTMFANLLQSIVSIMPSGRGGKTERG